MKQLVIHAVCYPPSSPPLIFVAQPLRFPAKAGAFSAHLSSTRDAAAPAALPTTIPPSPPKDETTCHPRGMLPALLTAIDFCSPAFALRSKGWGLFGAFIIHAR